MTYQNLREKWTEEGQKMIKEIDSPSPSCLKCSHFFVCKIAANMFPMMDQMFPNEKTRPFKPDDVAKLCMMYEHKLEDD